MLPPISWKFAFIFPLSAGGYILRNWKKYQHFLFSFLKTPAFNMMFTACVANLILAQIFGHKPFIEDIIGPGDQVRIVRRIIEEGIEAISYFIIFLSAIELFFNLKSEEKQ